MKIPKERVSRNIRRRLGMDELIMVFTNRLLESTCCSGLYATHCEDGKYYGRRSFVTTGSHSNSSERRHHRLS